MKVKIRVEQRHIDAGQPECADSCPIARALQEAGFRYAMMIPALASYECESRISWEGPDGWHVHVEAPAAANTFARCFDRGAVVAPFEFEIDPELASAGTGF